MSAERSTAIFLGCVKRGLTIAGLLLGLFFAAASPARATIRYEVSLAQPAQHVFHVTMTIPNVKGSVLVRMPAWDTLYQIRDFAEHMTDFSAASADGAPLHVTKTDGQTWRVDAGP